MNSLCEYFGQTASSVDIALASYLGSLDDEHGVNNEQNSHIIPHIRRNKMW